MTAMNNTQVKSAWQFAVALTLIVGSGAAAAAEYTLTAQEFDKAMPDGTAVKMWGYALPGGSPSVPGPALRVPAGESLTIHLTNNLPQLINGGSVPTSVIVPGQRTALAPVMFTDSTGRQRVRSFAQETASTQTVTYHWTAPTPGTYLYHSGTHPQVQVQMGLYGAVIVEAGSSLAYPSVPISAEVTLLYSEVDPALHAVVANGTYGNAALANPVTSTLNYVPKYFLVNGEAYTPGVTLPLATGGPGSPTLLRLLNAGIDTRVPLLQGLDMKLVAEDGKLYPYPRTQYSALLPALKTIDAVIVPTADGNLPIYDRRLALYNNASAPGGMFRLLRTGGAPIAQADAYTLSEDTQLTVNASGVLGNDFSPSGALTAALVTTAANGTLALAANGSFVYTPNPNFYGTDSFTYSATTSGGASATGTVTLTVSPVNDAPTVVADTFTVTRAIASVLDVLANDYDLEGSPVTLFAVDNLSQQGGQVMITGTTITYTPPSGFVGTDGFQYVIADSEGLLAAGSVTLTVQ
jgi:FtsP/CotA-like multicopper oxidase with cupredoxin domain